MAFVSVTYHDFRNIRGATLDIDAPVVYLVGENGQGKTNFIESIYLLCYGSSFRTRKDARLIAFGQDAAQVRGRSHNEGGIDRDIAVKIFRQGKKEIRVDGRLILDRMDLIENVPCIVFSHQDLSFITGSPEMGRRFFNQTLSLFDPLFVGLLRSYRKLLKSRNVLLKERNRSLLPAYTRNLVEVGLQIQTRRGRVIEGFNATFSPLFTRISGLGGKTFIRYRSSWPNGVSAEDVVEFMHGRENRDFTFETTTAGPHRDRFILMHQGREFSHIASTGQIRLCSLILRVAQANFFYGNTGRLPVLLLDDVLLELDSVKRERFIQELPRSEQAFFTFLPDEPFRKYSSDDTMIYRVVSGEFQREKSS
ncbi:MAG: DNA replication/repair protein RecF [Spirochaetaceae bacterium]|nr:MAG: DNA replication/repair protein RecF [Spirochaetaceae bacterium]